VKICIKLLGGTEWAADEFSFSVATFTEQDASDAKGTIYTSSLIGTHQARLFKVLPEML
jgi:hypothetical protein